MYNEKNQKVINLLNYIFPLKYFSVEEKYTSPKHWHKEIEMIYVETGMATISVDSKMLAINQGEVMIINGGAAHFYADITKHGKVWVIKFCKDILMNVNFSKENNNHISKLYDHTFMCTSDENLRKIISEILNSRYDDYQECYIISKLLEFTVYILRDSKIIFNTFSTVEASNSKFLTVILDYINENSAKDINLQMLADYLGFSVYYCSKYIKKNTGMNFIEYLNAVRIVNAEVLLLNTDKNITEIALETGFSSSSSFNRVFKKIKGKCPKEYRKSLKNN
jgi:YesN/AraC family two-component response regulator